MVKKETIADDLWLFRYPFSLLGTELGRVVTVVRLGTGRLIIHSTGPFERDDVESIRQLGDPGWLVEATLFHDTFTTAGRNAFPEVPYLGPERLPGTTAPLTRPPVEWSGEVDVLRLEGFKAEEHVFLHRASRTLIVADLVFNFTSQAPPWTRFFFRWAGGIRRYPGVSRLFRACIQDEEAFGKSIGRMMRWDFDRGDRWAWGGDQDGSEKKVG